jgi:6-pyruvoyl-tetrahydropterin synthase
VWWKSSVYSNNPHTIDDMKMAITEYIQNVDHALLNTVFENTVQHVNKYLEIGGGTLWTLLVTFCIVVFRCTKTFWSLCMYKHTHFLNAGLAAYTYCNSKFSCYYILIWTHFNCIL